MHTYVHINVHIHSVNYSFHVIDFITIIMNNRIKFTHNYTKQPVHIQCDGKYILYNVNHFM